MKSNTKAGLVFGISMAIFYIAYDLVAGNAGKNNKQLLIAIGSGVTSGTIAGFLFGWIKSRLSGSGLAGKTKRVDIADDEEIVFQSSASHYKGMEAVAGKLFLTNKRLIFKSDKINIRKYELHLPLDTIRDIRRYKPYGIINKGLAVQTTGQTEKFATERAAEWVERLLERAKKNNL